MTSSPNNMAKMAKRRDGTEKIKGVGGNMT